MTTMRPCLALPSASAIWTKLAVLLCLWLALGISQTALAQSVPVTSGLRIWLDASDINAGTTQPVNGSVVSTWRDKSGNGYNVSAIGSASAIFESAGMNGLPSVRMPLNSELSGANIFPGATSAATTIFIVHANVSLQPNFLLNLNGDTQGHGTANGRFSFHMPWNDGRYYFDAGGCCGTTRLEGVYPVSTTAPVIIAGGNSTTAYSGFTNTNQFVRFNGTTTASDSSAVAPEVVGGIRLGTTSGAPYDGRFSEVLVYNRALSLSEIQQVECYLGGKWNIPVSSSCTPVTFTATKTSTAFLESEYYPFLVSGSDVIYSINVKYSAGNYIDKDSMLIIDKLPTALTFFNGDYDGTGPAVDPVGFTNNGSPMIWTYASSVRYSNSSTAPTTFAGCSYTPTAGYDANVKYICFNPGGMFTSGNFTLNFRAQIK